MTATHCPTDAQARLLRAIASLSRTLGFPPTVHELADELGHASKHGVHQMLGTLERKGLVRRQPMTARSLLLTSSGQAWVRP